MIYVSNSVSLSTVTMDINQLVYKKLPYINQDVINRVLDAHDWYTNAHCGNNIETGSLVQTVSMLVLPHLKATMNVVVPLVQQIDMAYIESLNDNGLINRK